MSKKKIRQNPLADIRDEANIVYVVATKLEALARVLTQVRTIEYPDRKPAITPDDFVCIMQLFQENLDSLKDIAGGVDGAVEEAASGQLNVVHAV